MAAGVRAFWTLVGAVDLMCPLSREQPTAPLPVTAQRQAVAGGLWSRRDALARGTTLRNVRVADDLWESAKREAERQGRTLSDVIREALEALVAQPK